MILDRLDDFNRPDAALNTGAPWTYTPLTYAGTANTAEVSSSQLHATDTSYSDNPYRVEINCLSPNHSAQITQSSVTLSTTVDVGLHVMCRMDTSNATPMFYMFTSSKLNGQLIQKCIGGSFSVLSTVGSATPASGDVISGDCSGSTLTHTINATATAITDTAITTGLRVGFLTFRQSALVNIFGDNLRFGPFSDTVRDPRLVAPNRRAPGSRFRPRQLSSDLGAYVGQVIDGGIIDGANVNTGGADAGLLANSGPEGANSNTGDSQAFLIASGANGGPNTNTGDGAASAFMAGTSGDANTNAGGADASVFAGSSVDGANSNTGGAAGSLISYGAGDGANSNTGSGVAVLIAYGTADGANSNAGEGNGTVLTSTTVVVTVHRMLILGKRRAVAPRSHGLRN